MRQTTHTSVLFNEAEKALQDAFGVVDNIAMHNQKKVLNAFRQHRLTEEYFAERTGYGRNDPGREAIDKIFATVFGAEHAAVRMQLVSGTHAIACALNGNLLPGQRLACLTGTPYDTLADVIGTGKTNQPFSLRQQGIDYIEDHLDLMMPQDLLKERMGRLVSHPTSLAYIQKSCGYSFERHSLSNADIARLTAMVKAANPSCKVFVDNCYGEFVEKKEPPELGVDLVAGSLIKNPGGGLAIAGGYVAGKRDLVEAALNRITAPGVGGHQGLTYNQNRLLLQGLFIAPAVVADSVKGAMLCACVLSKLGLNVKPSAFEPRFDIIQAIELGNRERLINFCRAIQRWSPVNSHCIPEPALIAGYEDEVIMAAGTFVEGSTIELSADGPLRSPFAAFFQGGLTYLHVKCVLEEALALSASGNCRSFKGKYFYRLRYIRSILYNEIILLVPARHGEKLLVLQMPVKPRIRHSVQTDLMILSGTANPELAEEVANYLELSVAPVKIQPFSDGEIYVQVQASVRGQDCFVVQPTCSPVNENVMELLILLMR